MANNSLSSSPVTRKSKRSTVAGKTGAESTPPISLDDVARRAYAIYLEEGCPDGRHLDHWTRAESELRSS